MKTNVVYLLHFHAPLSHARHYIGSAQHLGKRLNEHFKGHGARITQVLIMRGIDFECVKTWNGGRTRERQLKRQKNSKRFCPLCTPKRRSA